MQTCTSAVNPRFFCKFPVQGHFTMIDTLSKENYVFMVDPFLKTATAVFKTKAERDVFSSLLGESVLNNWDTE